MYNYRQLNLDNGFQIRNTTEIGYLSCDKYPTQNEDLLRKYITIRNETVSNATLNQRFHIPEPDFDEYIYPQNSGKAHFFQILRWDTEEPFRAILINDIGEVVVAYTKDLENDLYDYSGSPMDTATRKRAEIKGIEYVSINETDDISLFFDKLYYEKVNRINIQDLPYIGLEVWSEYHNNLFDSDRSVDVLDYKNDYHLSEGEMRGMIRRNPILYQLPSSIFESFPYYYNIRKRSKVDDSRRAINKGYIIRADIQGSVDPEVVVMEVNEETDEVRFVTQHEATFFYRFDDINTKFTNSEKDVLSIVRRYIDR